MGSSSDEENMKDAARILEKFGVEYEITISSAHRSPARTYEWASSALDRGIEVIIAGAGGAAHLAGVIAAHTTLPVIGVPMEGNSPLRGLDALLSIVQMPRGVPVATMAIGKAGATNAGILAVQILANKDKKLREKLIKHKQELIQEVEAKAEFLQKAK